MEYVYASILLHKAGKEINEANISNVLTAAGVTVDAVRVKALVASLSEVNIEEAIKAAPAMMAAPAAAQAPAAPAAEAKPKEDEKKKKEDDKAKEEPRLEGLGAVLGQLNQNLFSFYFIFIRVFYCNFLFLFSASSFHATMGSQPQIIINVPGNAPKLVLSRKASNMAKDKHMVTTDSTAVFLPNRL